MKLNGAMCHSFVPSRGVRQGYPLSPYLFILCAEGFSLLKRGQELQQLAERGLVWGHWDFLFVDDSLAFLEATPSNLSTMRSVLHNYEISSGQKVNYQKSCIFFGRGCEKKANEELKQISGVEEEAR